MRSVADRLLARGYWCGKYLAPIPSHSWWRYDGLRGVGPDDLPGTAADRRCRPPDAPGHGRVVARGAVRQAGHRLRVPPRRGRAVAAGPAVAVAAGRGTRVQPGVRPRRIRMDR